MKNTVFVLIALWLGISAHAQQITKFAVVDYAKVITFFQKESKAVKDFDAASKKIQDEIDRQTKDIQTLKNAQAEAALKSEDSKVKALDAEITKKTNILKDYYQSKTVELEEQKKKISSASGSDFSDQLNDALRFVAESNGYSMVLNKNDNRIIVWYSSSVDITDKVIERLNARRKR
ncbi:outer membrane protein [Spirochaetia bacterium]|nr:outer membrane protein [Spirochaetia bacterium]